MNGERTPFGRYIFCSVALIILSFSLYVVNGSTCFGRRKVNATIWTQQQQQLIAHQEGLDNVFER